MIKYSVDAFQLGVELPEARVLADVLLLSRRSRGRELQVRQRPAPKLNDADAVQKQRSCARKTKRVTIDTRS
jgi:hypothetical protein